MKISVKLQREQISNQFIMQTKTETFKLLFSKYVLRKVVELSPRSIADRCLVVRSSQRLQGHLHMKRLHPAPIFIQRYNSQEEYYS